MDFTVTAGPKVRPGVDLPLVFEADLGGAAVPPSVARVQRRRDRSHQRPGRQPALAPVIDKVTPKDGAAVTGPSVRLMARVADAVSGVDAERISVEVDGERIAHRFDADSGVLTATARLRAGRHTFLIRAFNCAHAPVVRSVRVRVLP